MAALVSHLAVRPEGAWISHRGLGPPLYSDPHSQVPAGPSPVLPSPGKTARRPVARGVQAGPGAHAGLSTGSRLCLLERE